MLPSNAIPHRFAGEYLVPRWLTVHDEPRVADVLATILTFDGLTTGEVELVAEHRLDDRVARALWAIERRRWTAAIDAPIDPEAARAVVFESAARLSAEEALAESALVLGATPALLRASLFADRASRRRWCAPERASTASDLVARYNLLLVQSLLARAMAVDALISGDPRAIVRAAKRAGLLVRVSEDTAEASQTRLQIAGPLTMFHDTAKYGRSIARLVPSLVAAPSWSVRARVVLGARSAVLAITKDDAVLPGGALPASGIRLARGTVRALRAAGVEVDLQPEVLRRDGVVVVPDFALAWGDRRVFVEVLPFATERHLATRLATIERLGVPMILCVDERWASTISPRIVPFRGAIDAAALLAAASEGAA